MKNMLLNLETLENWQIIEPEQWQTVVKEIVDLFLQVCPDKKELLLTAFTNNDFVAVRNLSHTLKSSCGNVGAEVTYHILDRIERKCRIGHTHDLHGDLVEFDKNFSLTVRALLNYIEGLKQN